MHIQFLRCMQVIWRLIIASYQSVIRAYFNMISHPHLIILTVRICKYLLWFLSLFACSHHSLLTLYLNPQIFPLALLRNLVWHNLIIINYAEFSGRLILSRKMDTIKHLSFPIAWGVHGICLIVMTLCHSVSMFWLVNARHTWREMFKLLVSKGQGLDFTSKLPSTKLLIT